MTTQNSAVDDDLPSWDLDGFFPKGKARREEFVETLELELQQLEPMLSTDEIDPDDLPDLAVRIEAVEAQTGHLLAYALCRHQLDPLDSTVAESLDQARWLSRRAQWQNMEFSRRLAALDEEQFEELRLHPILIDASEQLTHWRQAGRQLLPREIEAYAALSAPTGTDAWIALYASCAAHLSARSPTPGDPRRHVRPSQRSTLLRRADHRQRRRDLHALSDSWKDQAYVAGAALNGILGVRVLETDQRELTDLSRPLSDNRMQSATLETLMESIDKQRPLLQRYLTLKAKLMGLHEFHLHDRFAPASGARLPTLSWDEACGLMVRSFEGVLPDMAHHSKALLAALHVDARPLDGKPAQALTVVSPRLRDAYICCQFDRTIGEVAAISQQFGQSYHHAQFIDVRQWCSRPSPVALKTSAMMAETLLIEGLSYLVSLKPTERLALLAYRLDLAVNRCLLMAADFEFERAAFAERMKAPVPTETFSELSVRSQQHWFGEALAADGADPLHWAQNPHFFEDSALSSFPTGTAFLISLSIVTSLAELGSDFSKAVSDFQLQSGHLPLEPLISSTLGWDITKPEVWDLAFGQINEWLDEFEVLAATL